MSQPIDDQTPCTATNETPLHAQDNGLTPGGNDCVESNSDATPQVDDLEQAYRQALLAMDAAELEVGRVMNELADEAANPDDIDDPAPISIGSDLETIPADSEHDSVDISVAPDETDDETASRVSPTQVAEAALFVGGNRLTAKQIAGILGGDFKPEGVTRIIDQLNRQYTAEGRPYEIQLLEGGYAMSLKPEFGEIQRRVFGLGPREIRLSQEVLEVLAFVAYEQPVTKQDLQDTGRTNAESVVRQLIRRQLVAVERDEEQPREVRYVTTPRFLQLFGLSDLDELPRAEMLNFK